MRSEDKLRAVNKLAVEALAKLADLDRLLKFKEGVDSFEYELLRTELLSTLLSIVKETET